MVHVLKIVLLIILKMIKYYNVENVMKHVIDVQIDFIIIVKNVQDPYIIIIKIIHVLKIVKV